MDYLLEKFPGIIFKIVNLLAISILVFSAEI